MQVLPPVKPFPNYKWRWAVLMPTESLNDPAVFHGVLRVLAANEGQPPSSESVSRLLRAVEAQTQPSADLRRTRERNLIRNSGQYWKALGLLGSARGQIELTDFGRRVASGGITKTEFAMTVIKTLELPNRHLEADTSDWDGANLRIKPLELILRILTRLLESSDVSQSFVTPFELVKIVIPLAGVKAPVEQHIEALLLYRQGQLDLSAWPDCAPESNDRRMAREFLLFLSGYGTCQRMPGRTNEYDKFVLVSNLSPELEQFERLDLTGESPVAAVRRVRETHLPSVADRQRVLTEVLSRPYQAVFRNNVLAAYNSTCLITGARLDAVLEAVHIIPVSRRGNDRTENGLCLRSDIHLLYDSGHLRMNQTGSLHLSEETQRDSNYRHLPTRVSVPAFVSVDNIAWRWNYY